MKLPFPVPSLSPTQLLWSLATLVLLAALGLRLHGLWPPSEMLIQPPPVAESAVVPRLDTASLAKLSLFRTPVASGPLEFRIGTIAVGSPLLRNAPQSSLNARLVGVLNGPQGIAVVEHANRQSSYSRGDALAGEAELVRIFNDRIIISRQGQYEALLLD
ncbi:MAG TPA: hypothetical protein DHV72_08595 [Serratia grimesii]|uniref:Type II secretion system protein GspC N-terminal domain-containing protein n=1 Tax=Serratia grimesii TaxID=82995 RepID=A0A9C7QU12_9GAMM|nr:type II secretion system protein N [Serratia grimesii]HCK00071.1 hypothetical protein [Serratia grimesii]